MRDELIPHQTSLLFAYTSCSTIRDAKSVRFELSAALAGPTILARAANVYPRTCLLKPLHAKSRWPALGRITSRMNTGTFSIDARDIASPIVGSLITLTPRSSLIVESQLRSYHAVDRVATVREFGHASVARSN